MTENFSLGKLSNTLFLSPWKSPVTTLLLGFLFGTFLQYARLNRFDTIVGMALLRDLSVAKTMAFAIGLGMLLMQTEIQMGWASDHVKPLILVGVVGGGVLFGMGMAILGYCPGTLAISLGQGSLDALVGILGGLAGALSFAVVFPLLSPLLGPDLGSISLKGSLSAPTFWMTLVLLGGGLMGVALALHRVDPRGWSWLYAAVGLALLNVALDLPAIAGHPMGASTAFPWLAMTLTGMGAPGYWHKIAEPGAWEFHFLIGAFLAGLVFSLIQKEFRFRAVPDLWREYHGNSSSRRFFWAFVGGILLLFGARMAGGCTSGHIISGGMQLADSSLLFALVVFLSFLTTGRLFHRQGRVG